MRAVRPRMGAPCEQRRGTHDLPQVQVALLEQATAEETRDELDAKSSKWS